MEEAVVVGTEEVVVGVVMEAEEAVVDGDQDQADQDWADGWEI